MDKDRRKRAIIGLISREAISNQAELKEKLIILGFDVTQATLSRDLKELGVSKAPGEDGMYKYTIPEGLRDMAVRSCSVSGNLIVFRTAAGMAPAIAYRVDAIRNPAILGTVAGEDTLLVVVAEEADTKAVKEELWRKLAVL